MLKCIISVLVSNTKQKRWEFRKSTQFKGQFNCLSVCICVPDFTANAFEPNHFCLLLYFPISPSITLLFFSLFILISNSLSISLFPFSAPGSINAQYKQYNAQNLIDVIDIRSQSNRIHGIGFDLIWISIGIRIEIVKFFPKQPRIDLTVYVKFDRYVCKLLFNCWQ